MQKYKLIKCYPNSPSLGTVCNINSNNSEYLYSPEIGTYSTLPKSYIENQPEFWEKIEEKTYEILSFILTETLNKYETVKKGTIVTRYYANNFSSKNGVDCTEDRFLANEKWSIHSVKRLSDGEIFTIGDKYYPNKDKEFIDTLKNFEFILDNILRIQGINSFMNLESIIKAVPLFKTEDGVDIYEGNHFWYAQTTGEEVGEKEWYVAETFWTADNTTVKNPVGGKYFSTKKAAEKYIQDNKPKTFTTEDGFEVGIGDMIYSVSTKGTWDCVDRAVSISNKFLNGEHSGVWKFFKLKENRDKYREENIPKYSEKQMIHFTRYATPYLSPSNIENDLKNWKIKNDIS